MKLQKFSEGLKEELADEMKLASGHKDSCEICCREEVSRLISVLFEYLPGFPDADTSERSVLHMDI